MLEVDLRTRSKRPRRAVLRELTGADELLASRQGSGAATRIVERLLVDSPQAALRPEHASNMPVVDRDWLLASLYRLTFGERVECLLSCGRCGKPFGMDFSLDALVAEIERDADENAANLGVEGPDEEGFFRFPDGTRFRLPTTADERALRGLDPAVAANEILRRCCPSGPSRSEDDAHRERLERAFSALAPLIAATVPTSCAACGADQEADFDIVSFFVAALARERGLLIREVHTLARAYGWSFEQIAELPRSERHAYVELIEAERGNLEESWAT